MVDPVQSDKTYHNKVDGDHVVQQARSNKDQDPGNERNDWRDKGGSEMHDYLGCKKKVAPIPGKLGTGAQVQVNCQPEFLSGRQRRSAICREPPNEDQVELADSPSNPMKRRFASFGKQRLSRFAQQSNFGVGAGVVVKTISS
jgi:hypothetical protein